MYGVASLIFWALMVVVSIKYAGFIMRAHNRGDGGIMALTALLQRNRVAHGALLVTLGIFGAALFFGDGIITPAISVLGSIQGVQVATPALAHLVVPLSVAILLGLFVLQRFGSGTIGWLFGPVILVWFTVIGVLGLSEVLKDPAVLQGLSPSWAVRFMIDHGAAGYLVLGGVVLAVTGAEALYADRGHFGASPIRLGWFGLALPALMLNYLGQAVFILHHPALAQGREHASTPSTRWHPAGRYGRWSSSPPSRPSSPPRRRSRARSRWQSRRCSSAFSRGSRSCTPRRSKARSTCRSSTGRCASASSRSRSCSAPPTKLGDIYGVAVTGTFILNTILFLAVARLLWGTAKRKLAPVAVLFLTVEVAFFSSNIAKVEHGAWLPLAVGLVISIVMINWRRGQVIVTRNRVAQEGPLDEFLDGLAAQQAAAHPHPGVAVFLCRDKDTTPLALRADVEHTHTLPAEGRDRLGRHRQHPARRNVRQMRGRSDRPRPVQGRPPHRPIRLPRQAQHPRGARAGAQARPARAQPRPRARVLLRLAHHDHPDRRPGHATLAQEAVHRAWPATRRARSITSGYPSDRTVIMGSQVAL